MDVLGGALFRELDSLTVELRVLLWSTSSVPTSHGSHEVKC